MKNGVPKINFFYSPIYDFLLTEYEGKHFHKKQKKEVENYIRRLQILWQKVNKPILRFLLKIFKNNWSEKEITCYIVKYFRLSGISHPLTIKMTRNLEEAIINLVHELIHVFLPLEKWRRISQNLVKRFPNERPEIILHIYTDFIQLQALKKFFGKAATKKMLKKYKKFKRTGRAWKIVLREENNLRKLFKVDLTN
ncbi:hypothetical protein COX73_03215 [bacterium (Candidatus Gribaldobacteria) CG_4_10_14_0_2_um_filter_36_18]|uniref:Uncharacterized protein n=1 Tax=bacterium (Candidatus Gribaldobacteria) CG_4_10_14_0_2_um_filter_36_18 TaxID=2014264 RepID=A0A2M7VJJ1_9BACT|nr:MAG: hypothetical protein COX73_03215 [bacterium (Candidatus Gribaldobacteria) CG_4_10_14_0_2_um_filter_36_18]